MLQNLKDNSKNNVIRKLAFFLMLAKEKKESITYKEIKHIRSLFKRYDKVIVREMWSERIGEFVLRSSLACMEAVDNPGILYIYFLTNYELLNVAVYDSLLRQDLIKVIPADKRLLWSYVVAFSPKAFFESANNYKDDSGGFKEDFAEKKVDSSFTRELYLLSEENKKRCEEIAEKIELGSVYVCMSNRDDTYMHSTFGYGSSFRNSKFETRELAIRYLKNEGIQTVRMGKIVERVTVSVPYIRYAEDYHDDYMDLYLSKNCKFFVADTSGVAQLANAYGKPVVWLNAIVPQLGGFVGIPQNEWDLMIFKKYYDKRKKRLLNLKEMIEIQYRYPYDGGFFFERAGIELVDNSSDEILAVVKEMNQRLDGTYVICEEKERLQILYKEIVHDCLKKYKHAEASFFQGRMGDSFLQNNGFLFEGL